MVKQFFVNKKKGKNKMKKEIKKLKPLSKKSIKEIDKIIFNVVKKALND